MKKSISYRAKCGLFYLAFYGVLAALFSTCMWVFLKTIDPKIPKWQLGESLIGSNPSLNILRFLDEYNLDRQSSYENARIKTCSHLDLPIGSEVCEVNISEWEQCNSSNLTIFGKRSSDCVFLKLNRIYGWTPEHYTNDSELPPEMPEQLKDHIKSINITEQKQNIWLSCDGRTSIDKEYIQSISYFPKKFQGFPGYYFPYLNNAGYLSPLVAVKFVMIPTNKTIDVECRVWAKNIQHKMAYLRFKIQNKSYFSGYF